MQDVMQNKCAKIFMATSRVMAELKAKFRRPVFITSVDVDPDDGGEATLLHVYP
jgi:hypothetical protein